MINKSALDLTREVVKIAKESRMTGIKNCIDVAELFNNEYIEYKASDIINALKNLLKQET